MLSRPKTLAVLALTAVVLAGFTQTKPAHAGAYIAFVGNSIFTSAELSKLALKYEHHRLTPTSLKALSDAVTAFYHAHGYVTSFATVSSQRPPTISVHEGRVEVVHVDNKSRVSTPLVQSLVQPALGPVFNLDAFTSKMNVISSIAPGSTSFLSPGEDLMTTDIHVVLPPQALYTGSASFDDFGMPYTGSLTLHSNNTLTGLLHHGDTLLFNVSSSYGFTSVQASYSLLVNRWGGTAGIGYGADSYTVGNGFNLLGYGQAPSVFKVLGLSGYGQSFSAFYTQPVFTTSVQKLAVTGTYTHSIQSDTYDALAGVADDRNIDAVALSATYIDTDHMLGIGQDTAVLTLTGYNLTTFGAGTSSYNPYGASTPGLHSFLRWDLSRTNSLPGPGNTLFFSTTGLFSGGDGALDPLEEYSLGGEGTVRGFATASLFGYNAVDATIELRHVLASVKTGQLMTMAFFDYGGIQLEPAASFSTAGTSSSASAPFVTLMSPGIGMKYAYKQLSASLEAGMPVGGLPSALGASSSVAFGQLWFSVGVSY